MKKLLLLTVLMCGCVERAELVMQKNDTSNIKYTDYRLSYGCNTWIMDYEGNKYIVVLTADGAAICPALPAKVENE